MHRAIWHRVLCGLGIIALASSCARAESKALAIVTEPCLQYASETSATIVWLTNRDCVSWVEYGISPELGTTAQHAEHGLIDAQERIHKITLTGLTPGTTYYYRVASREILDFQPYEVSFGETITSEPNAFMMPGGDRCSFIVLNDVHESRALWEAEMAVAKTRSFDLVFLNGDLMSHLNSEGQWIDHFLNRATHSFARQTPFVYIRGNHETRGQWARHLPAYLAMPGGHYYCAFRYGPAEVLILDGGEDKEDNHPEYSGLVSFKEYRDEETRWLENALQRPAFREAAFRIAFCHMPLRSGEYAPRWAALLNAAHLDLMICGHTHDFEIVPGGQGLLECPTIIGGGSEKAEATVIHGEMDASMLKISVFNTEGALLGEHALRR